MKDKTVNKRMAAYRERRKQSGTVVVSVTVPAGRAGEIKQLAAKIRADTAHEDS